MDLLPPHARAAIEYQAHHCYTCGTQPVVCDTEPAANPTELVVDASNGAIPLWERHSILRWTFQERSFQKLTNPEAAKNSVCGLMDAAVNLWEVPNVPVRFDQDDTNWDFEIVVRDQSRCSTTGCVLASAFFPDPGRNQLILYPTLFEQSSQEQIETMAHELGHIFGLRHFFALQSERPWPSAVFGSHSPFSIMNYGVNSRMTDNDRNDLRRLYELAWTHLDFRISGRPVELVEPWSKGR